MTIRWLAEVSRLTIDCGPAFMVDSEKRYEQQVHYIQCPRKTLWPRVRLPPFLTFAISGISLISCTANEPTTESKTAKLVEERWLSGLPHRELRAHACNGETQVRRRKFLEIPTLPERNTADKRTTSRQAQKARGARTDSFLMAFPAKGYSIRRPVSDIRNANTAYLNGGTS